MLARLHVKNPSCLAKRVFQLCQSQIEESSGREQTVEERSIALKGDSKILSRDFVAPVPLTFQPFSLLREGISQPLHEFSHERVRFLDSASRLIDEAALNFLPPASNVARLLISEERLTPVFLALIDLVRLRFALPVLVFASFFARLLVGPGCYVVRRRTT